METLGLIAVTPIGISLVLAGILYFAHFGRFVLPGSSRECATSGQSVGEYMRGLYGIDTKFFEVIVPAGSDLEGQLMDDVMARRHVHIIGSYLRSKRYFLPLVAETAVQTPCRLAILGERTEVQNLAAEHGARLLDRLRIFADDYAPTVAGMAEVAVPPGASIVGECAVDLLMRSVYGVSVIAIHRGEETLSLVETEDHEPTRVGMVPLQTGDTLVAFTNWGRLAKLSLDRDFVVVTQGFPREERRPKTVLHALVFFLLAVGMVLFSDMRLSPCLLVGASGMILSNVLSIEEACEAVSWSTVFLLASLLPLGHAVQNTGTAA